MTLQDLDHRLSLWNNQLATAAQNLMDLQSHPTYERLADPHSGLQGKTATQAALAVNTLSMLLRYYELLQGAVSRAEELRRDLPVLFGAEQRLEEVRQVLEGRSIQLPPVQVPLGQRGLLNGMENVNSISPAALLNTMAKAFEEAKAIVLAIDTACEALGKNIEAASNRVGALGSDPTLLDETDRAQLRETESKLQQLNQAATCDPLGTEDELAAGITSKLYELHNKAARNRQMREQLAADLDTAALLLTTAKSAHEEAGRLYAEACEKVASAQPPHPRPDTEVEALASWLERLRLKGNEGAVAAVKVGLRNWTQAAQEAIRNDRTSTEASRKLLEARSELRGRLDALKAKARAYSMAEEQALMALAEQAQRLLYHRPSALDQAASLVSEYETKLNFLAQKNVKK